MKEFDIKITCPKCGSNKCAVAIDKELECDFFVYWLVVTCKDCWYSATGTKIEYNQLW